MEGLVCLILKDLLLLIRIFILNEFPDTTTLFFIRDRVQLECLMIYITLLNFCRTFTRFCKIVFSLSKFFFFEFHMHLYPWLKVLVLCCYLLDLYLSRVLPYWSHSNLVVLNFRVISPCILDDRNKLLLPSVRKRKCYSCGFAFALSNEFCMYI